MARLVTVEEIFRRARKKADMSSSGFFKDVDMYDLLNSSSTLLYDVLVQAYQNYFTAPFFNYTLVPGTSQYDLPDDFYKLIALEQQFSATQFATVFPYNELERNSTIFTSNSIPNATVRLRYVTAPPVYANLTDTLDGIAGWDDIVVTDMAKAMLEAEESDTTAVTNRLGMLLDRVKTVSQNRDITNPGTVSDVTAYDNGFLQNTLQYRFYGDAIEFLSLTYFGI